MFCWLSDHCYHFFLRSFILLLDWQDSIFHFFFIRPSFSIIVLSIMGLSQWQLLIYLTLFWIQKQLIGCQIKMKTTFLLIKLLRQRTSMYSHNEAFQYFSPGPNGRWHNKRKIWVFRTDKLGQNQCSTLSKVKCRKNEG